MQPRNLSSNSIGLIIFITGISLAPAMDSVAKLLVDKIPASEIAFVRFAVQTATLFIFISLSRTRATLTPTKLLPNLLLGMILALSLVAFFTSLRWLPLANATAIFFTEPLAVTVLSHWLLGEKVGWRRYLAVLVGLVGALIVIRPSFIEIGWPALLPALGAVFAALYMILASKLTKSEHPLTMQLSSGIGGFLFLGVALAAGSWAGQPLFSFVWPNVHQWQLLFLAGLLGATVAVLMVYALKHAKVSFLAPFGYFEIITAVILSAVIFNEVPDALTWVGIAIITGSGLFILWRENKATKST